jgi:serine/threonine-protein kinase
VFGTTCYMSPEQARGLVVDFRSDQFSCGATLYEIATGRRAFQRPTTAQTLAAIIEDEPEPIASLNPETPGPFRWIVERCLAKDPAERYASTWDLARELRTVRDRLSEVSTAVGLTAPHPRLRKPWLLAGPAALLLAASLVPPVRQAALRWAGFPAVPRERHLAVLPFSESGNTDAGFVEGLAETLTGRLTQLERFQGSLWVVPASEVRQARVGSASAARRTFGVNLVVTGSAQRSGGRLRLTANLVDAETLRQIRSTALDAPISEAAVWQEDVVDHVVNMLDLEIGPEARKVLRAGVTQVAGAYELYLQGRSELMHFEDLESIGRAIGLFQRAVQQDPSYALAYAGMGEAHWRRYQLTKQLASAELGQKACQRAAELNDLLAPVHVTLGLIHAGTGRHEQAIQDFERALALDPGNVEAWRESAVSREAQGRLDEAEATYKKAVALKPDYWAGENALAGYYYRHGRYSEAETLFGQALALAPDNGRVLSNLGGLYQVLGRLPEAQAMLERAVQLRPDPDALSNLASLQFSRKLFPDAARSFEQAVQIRSEDSGLWHNLASAYYWVPGGREKARAAFERAARLAERERSTNPRDPSVLMRLADCNAMIGKPAEARAYAAAGLALAPANVNLMVDAAAIYEQLGERALALDWLRKALRGGFPPKRLERRQDLVELRTDPRYRSLAGS